MPSCCVTCCSSRSLSTEKVSYHSFPRDPRVRAEWVKALGKEDGWEPSKDGRVCSKHFHPENLEQTLKGRTHLCKHAIPSFHLHKEPPQPLAVQGPMEQGFKGRTTENLVTTVEVGHQETTLLLAVQLQAPVEQGFEGRTTQNLVTPVEAGPQAPEVCRVFVPQQVKESQW
ncbi:THAP domain-containing protein 1 isoform X2 [Ixodes scapularis]|uniref:THAP domain-containing protein 1 isoform X2 n=1 Tax=Ixodes scapularis TaxID=6945 RepID=UPI001A9D1673|nr:THAP domain-containing protein 1 isoform X2 [Ixodes scapularis]